MKFIFLPGPRGKHYCGQIWRGPVQTDQLLDRAPSDLGVHPKNCITSRHGAPEAVKLNTVLAVRADEGAHHVAELNLETKLFVNLSHQSLPGCLTNLHLASREFPFES